MRLNRALASLMSPWDDIRGCAAQAIIGGSLLALVCKDFQADSKPPVLVPSIT